MVMSLSIRFKSLIRQRYAGSATGDFRTTSGVSGNYGNWQDLNWYDLYADSGGPVTITKVGSQIHIVSGTSDSMGLVFGCAVIPTSIEEQNAIETKISLEIEACLYNAGFGFLGYLKGGTTTTVASKNAIWFNTVDNKLRMTLSVSGSEHYSVPASSTTNANAEVVSATVIDLPYSKSKVNRYGLELLITKGTTQSIRVFLFINGKLVIETPPIISDEVLDYITRGGVPYLVIPPHTTGYIDIESMSMSR